MTTAAALVTLSLAFTAPASRLAPPRVSSARMMCDAVMPETPPALESDCGFDHVPLSIALQSGDFLEARPPGPPATTHTACPRRRRRRPFASRRRGWQQTAFAAAASPSPGAALGLLMPPAAPQADQITRDALIKLAGDSAVSRGYVYFAEVPNLPEADLATIERLWLAYSGGKFGYSVQVKALQGKKVNNNLEKLFDKIGWRNEKGQLLRWLPEKAGANCRDASSLLCGPLSSPAPHPPLRPPPRQANNEFIYELDAAPEGHLPLTNTLRGQQLITALFKHPVWARDEFQ